MNKTIENFGYPSILIKEYENWVVMLRPKQITLGCLVLAEKSAAISYGEITDDALMEQKKIVQDIELNLKNQFGAEKFNYLMLMMVDPNVHFHVIPRYSEEKEFSGKKFTDPNWSSPPDMGNIHDLSENQTEELLQTLRESWVSA